MGKFLKGFGGIAIFVGIMALAGAAGDCDGKCMEYANSLSEMLWTAAAGLALVAAGGLTILADNR